MDFDIQRFRKDLPIIRETADQIIKDFRFFDIHISFSGDGDHAYQELSDQIRPVIGELLLNQFERFLSLMYKIDVGDKSVQQALDLNDNARVSVAITDVIIQRELLKVVTRNYFRQKRLEEGDTLF